MLNKDKLIKYLEDEITNLENAQMNATTKDEEIAAIGGKVALRQLYVLLLNNQFQKLK